MRDRGNKTDDWAPSRLKSIEEVPVALGFLVVANGDFEQSIFGAANYGRDNDSIAGMAGAIAGALHGDGVIRPEWIAQVNAANQVDLDPLARDLTDADGSSPTGSACGGTSAAAGIRRRLTQRQAATARRQVRSGRMTCPSGDAWRRATAGERDLDGDHDD